jgi:hypothetical protein
MFRLRTAAAMSAAVPKTGESVGTILLRTCS